MDPRLLPSTLDAPLGEVLLADGASAGLSELERRRLLPELRAGKGPDRLTITARVFRQAATPNRNFVRFRDELLPQLAQSFVGVPFLADHDQHHRDKRGGRVIATDLRDGELHATIELVKPWAIEDALDGTMDRFSIGWLNTGPVVCSICEAPFAAGLFGAGPSCTHLPGDTLGDGDERRHVELLVTAATGIEISTVTVPAVEGTGVEQIRAALSHHRQDTAARRVRSAITQRKPMKLMLTLAKRLGVLEGEPPEGEMPPADEVKTEAGILAAVEKLLADQAAAEAQISATQKELAAARDALLEQVRAIVEGKAGKGEQGKALCASAERLAGISIAEALAFARSLPQIVPTGPLLSRESVSAAAGKPTITAQQKRIAKQLGLSEEQYLAVGQE